MKRLSILAVDIQQSVIRLCTRQAPLLVYREKMNRLINNSFLYMTRILYTESQKIMFVDIRVGNCIRSGGTA